MITGTERRKYPRQQLSCLVQIKSLDGAGPALMQHCFARNCSRGGLELISYDFYACDGRVHVRLMSEHNVAVGEVSARVVWVQQVPYQDKFRVGLKFTAFNHDACDETQGLLDELMWEQIAAVH